MRCYYIPRVINQQYVYIWRSDEIPFLAFPFAWLFLIGGYSGVILFLVNEIISAKFLKRLGSDKPNGYMKHWMRFNFPRSFIRWTYSLGKASFANESSLFKRAEALPPAYLRYLAG